jgi:hypothetical protein
MQIQKKIQNIRNNFVSALQGEKIPKVGVQALVITSGSFSLMNVKHKKSISY